MKRMALSLLCLALLSAMGACAVAPGQVSPTALPTTRPTLTPSPAPSLTLSPALTSTANAVTAPFDGDRAYQDLNYQMSLGPRVPESQAHAQEIDWIRQSLESSGWKVEIQETTRMGHPVRNVIAKRGTTGQWTIIGAHFDSRMQADRDPDPAKRTLPVPAANDGASGVAVLLELARVLPKDLNQQVWLAFFDAEDQGGLPGWDWLLGSRALAESLTAKPDAVIVIDMIGDAALGIYKEKNSNSQLTDEIWSTAASLGYEQQFIPSVKWDMLDDHTPFLEKGIRAVDVIDFDYPYWHTTADTADKTSAQSLKIVGDTLLHWILDVAVK